MDQSGRIHNVQIPIVWPWFVGGVLSPLLSNLFSRWVPNYISAALVFFTLFSAAAVVVTRRQSPRPPLPRLLAGSAAGAAITGALRYWFS